MSIIDQLEQSVTPAILGEQGHGESVAHISLLEQFYAILATRLALPQVYSQLLRDDMMTANESITERPLFEQLWQDQIVQKTIIQELSAAHHIDESSTTQLVINAAPLAYRELKVLANGQFLPAFLQAEQSALRPYLPIWSTPIVTASHEVGHKSTPNAAKDHSVTPLNEALPSTVNNAHPSPSAAATTAVYVEETQATDGLSHDDHVGASSETTHISPAAQHLVESDRIKREQVRTRNQRNDLFIRVFLLVLALAAMAFAAWALFIKPKNEIPVAPTATPAVTPEPPVPAPTLTPIELIVGVDDSGNLYTCSATVGDAALQRALQQALNTSFGEQASICELKLQDKVATTIANMPLEMLPNVLTMLRSTPFARLHLQDDRVTIEAPDSMQLQQLVADIRNLVPAMAVDSTAPIPLPNNSRSDMADVEGANRQFNDNTDVNNQYNNDGSVEYQSGDEETADRVIPAPQPNNGGFNDTPNDLPDNTLNAPSASSNVPSSLPTNVPSSSRTNRPAGPISESEADAMASSVIVAEPAQVR